LFHGKGQGYFAGMLAKRIIRGEHAGDIPINRVWPKELTDPLIAQKGWQIGLSIPVRNKKFHGRCIPENR